MNPINRFNPRHMIVSHDDGIYIAIDINSWYLFCVFNDLSWEVVVRYVGKIIYHHCLNHLRHPMITIPFPLLILAIVILNFWISAQSLIMIWLSAIQYKASIHSMYKYVYSWPEQLCIHTLFFCISSGRLSWWRLRLRFIFTCFQQNTTFVTRILLAASSYNGHRLSKNIRLTLLRVKMWIESKWILKRKFKRESRCSFKK
jgi:hypothetical protein